MIIFQFCSLFFSSNTTYWNLECTGSAYAIAPQLEMHFKHNLFFIFFIFECVENDPVLDSKNDGFWFRSIHRSRHQLKHQGVGRKMTMGWHNHQEVLETPMVPMSFVNSPLHTGGLNNISRHNSQQYNNQHVCTVWEGRFFSTPSSKIKFYSFAVFHLSLKF